MNKQDEILLYWFGNIQKEEAPEDSKQKIWFLKSDLTDKEIKEKFLKDVENAISDIYCDWENNPDSALSLILLLDQFTRNIYRDTPLAFSGDSKALEIAEKSINKGFDKLFHPVKRVFFYMPFEHSEDINMQKKLLELFSNLISESKDDLKPLIEGFSDYAQKHYDIVEKFGRFPHRNKILGRESTNEEIEFLKQPGSSF